MLKEIAIADAYGAGFEFAPYSEVKEGNDLSRYLPHGLYGFSGKYTDDTQMSIALAELIVGESGFTKAAIADKFVECFKRDPREGYSKGFQQLLNEVKSGGELLARIRPESSRNGAAMRSVPIGAQKDKSQVLGLAREQAAITHKTEVGIRSSCAVALAAHFGLHVKGELGDLRRFLAVEGCSGWDYCWSGPVPVEARPTVSAAFTALLRNRSVSELLLDSVAFGGDTDSVAAIAVGLATCFREYDLTLPDGLVEGLNEPTYGLEYLQSLDQKLFAMHGLS